MLIEPTAATPPSGRRRARTMAAVAAPVVVLIVVVGAGFLGGDPGGSDGRVDASGQVLDPVSAAPARSQRPASAPSSSAVPGSTAATTRAAIPAYPARVLGLRVQTVADALTARRSGDIDDELVAIGAWLAIESGPRDCAPGSARRPAEDPAMCHRGTSLMDRAGISRRAGDSPAMAGSSLLAHAFPGVSLGALDAFEAGGAAAPDSSVDADGAAPGASGSAPVVVVGRFGDPRLVDRRSNARHPDIGFAIERLVWLAGRWQERGVAQTIPRTADEVARSEVPALASSAFPGGTVVLYFAALDPAELATFQPAAAGIVDGAASDALYWYVRIMTRTDPPQHTLASDTSPRRLGWVVLAPDGTVLGSALDA